MPDTPILTQIRNAMVEMIEGIELGSYHYIWHANQPDAAKMQFPTANIFLETETSLDDPNGPDSDMYFQECTFRIEVTAQLEQEMENPRWSIQDQLDKALDDLKCLFGNDYSVDGTADIIMYRGSNIEYRRNNDIFIPARLITRWIVRYEQDRRSPDTVA